MICIFWTPSADMQCGVVQCSAVQCVVAELQGRGRGDKRGECNTEVERFQNVNRRELGVRIFRYTKVLK